MSEFRKSGNDFDSDDSRHQSKSAREKLMDHLAKRAHSELELRQKLARDYHEDDITDAIETAKAKGWLAEPSELASDVAQSLDRKRKGHDYINQFLNERGLPSVGKDDSAELEKARAFLLEKVGAVRELSRDERMKFQRNLAARGFDEETIVRAMKDFGGALADEAAAATDVVGTFGSDDASID
jgi:SOS response regulatory protein OraA/RecX